MIISDYLILIADDHPLYRSALGNIVADSFDDVAVVECEDVESAVALVLEKNIDLVLLDLSMPDADGLDGVRMLREASPTTPVIICSAMDDPQLVRESFNLGVSGYLPKSSGAEVTRHALQLVRSGGVYVPTEALGESVDKSSAQNEGSRQTPEGNSMAALTPRQRAVMSLLERGMSNKLIARELGIGEITVKAHVSAILRKLGVDNRVQAVVASRDLRR
jgi:DNA-binding NarL/FixJ family response regulator